MRSVDVALVLTASLIGLAVGVGSVLIDPLGSNRLFGPLWSFGWIGLGPLVIGALVHVYGAPRAGRPLWTLGLAWVVANGAWATSYSFEAIRHL